MKHLYSYIRSRAWKFFNEDIVRLGRDRFATSDFKKKEPRVRPLTAEEKKDIVSYWNYYIPIKKHLPWFGFYANVNSENHDLRTYIPDSIYYKFIDMYFSQSRKANVLDDKNLYNLYFHDVKQPRTLLRKMGDNILDADYSPVTFEDAITKMGG